MSGDPAYKEAVDGLSTPVHVAVMEAFNAVVELRPTLLPEPGLGVAVSVEELLAKTIASIDQAAGSETDLSGLLRLAEAKRLLSAAASQP